jgi:hypothetical protein
MRIVRILAIGLLAAGAACSRDNDGVLVTPDPTAGLRYVNLVSDTGAMDFRIINVIGDAPNTESATFRTGGLVFGNVNPSPTQPPYQPVRAGTPINIRVFMSGTSAAVASTQMFDTTMTFDPGQNYTFFLYGTARTGTVGTSADKTGPFPLGNRCCSVLLTKDSVPTLAAGKWAVRVLNLAPTYAGAPTAPANGAAIDVRFASTSGATPTAAASTATVGVITNTAPGNLSGYVSLDTTGTNAAAVPGYKLVAVANGTTSPAVFQAVLPLGTRGSSTSNPFAGTSVAGTAITAVILPRSTPASTAPQTAAASVTTNIDSLTRSTDTVTIWRRIAAQTATACAAPVAPGASANDVLTVSGLTQPEYNGVQTVISTTTGATPTLFSQKTLTLTGATGAFTLSFGGATSAALAPTATAAQVEAAIAGLTGVGASSVSVTGAAGGPYSILFMGSLAGTSVGTLSASAAGGLTAAVANAAVGCAVNPLQTRDTVTFTATVATDSFKVTVNGQTTPALAANATAATIQTAVQALSSVGSSGTPAVSNVAVTGAAGGPYVFTFSGTLNNANVAFSSAMTAGSVGTLAVGKAAYTFTGPATPSRIRYRITGTPVALATGTPAFKIVTNTNDFTLPSAIFLFDKQPPRTAP